MGWGDNGKTADKVIAGPSPSQQMRAIEESHRRQDNRGTDSNVSVRTDTGKGYHAMNDVDANGLVNYPRPARGGAKKSAAKKPATKKPVAKKPVAKKPAAKKPAAKKPVAKKPAAKKSASKK